MKTGLLAGAGARAPATPSPAPSAAQPGLLSDQRSGLGGRAAQRRGPTPSSRSRTTRVPRGRRPGPTHSPLRSLPGKGSPHPPQSRRPGGSSETCPRRPQLTWPGAPEAEHREPGSCAHRGLFNLRGSLRSRPSGSDARALLGDAGSAALGLRFRTWAPLLAGPPAAAACDPFWRAGRGVGGARPSGPAGILCGLPKARADLEQLAHRKRFPEVGSFAPAGAAGSCSSPPIAASGPGCGGFRSALACLRGVF